MLSCECDADVGPSVYDGRTVVARKEHKCTECGRTINPGEEYEYVFGVWDGAAQTFKTCEECEGLGQSLVELGFCIEHGGIRETHQEYLSVYQPPKISAAR